MAHRASFDHTVNCEEETNAGAQAGAVASTSTEEAPGAVAVVQAAGLRRHGSRGALGCVTVCERNVEGYLRQESESNPQESDNDDEDDLSISDRDTSDAEQEEAGPSVVAAAPPTAPAAAAGPHRSRRRRRCRRRRRAPFLFTQWQVEEMESLFQETHYPDVLTRGELARTLNVPEVKVKVWFINRRAKQRRIERRGMLRNVPPGAEDFICLRDAEEPS